MYILFEDFSHFDLLPFCYTRPVYELRSGILTFRERWEKVLQKAKQDLPSFENLVSPVYTVAYDYLGLKYTNIVPFFGTSTTLSVQKWINGKFAPNEEFLRLIAAAETGVVYVNDKNEILVFAAEKISLQNGLVDLPQLEAQGFRTEKVNIEAIALRKMPDIFLNNAKLIHYDFELLTKGRKSEKINDRFSAIYGEDNIFVEEGVKVRAAVINAENGLVYLGKNVDIQEGAMIHGTHAFCDNSVANMGAKLRGDSTFGPYCKVGGEIGNSVIMGYSNKGHDGYLGNSVLGYWCNLGADTNTSNLKNTYEKVKLWNYVAGRFENTGQQFCGLMMGDHAKCGINTMFNTGTVVGVSANVFGEGFPRNFIPDFSWGGANGLQTYQIVKAFQTATAVMERRKMEFDETEKRILTKVFELTKEYRTWEK